VLPSLMLNVCAQEYDKKKEEKNRNRQIYYLRHARDYEALGIPVGTPKSEIKAIWKKLALKWHPDRQPPEKQEEAKRRFQEMSAAYESLMRTDEDVAIKALQA
jgi:DnaJ-class molecular chaperone